MTDEMSLVVFDPMKLINADILAKDAVQQFDHKTPEGEKALRSWVHRCRGHKGDLERCRITAKEGAAKYVKQVNGIAADLTAEIQTIIDVRMKPLNEIEAAKLAAAEKIVEDERIAKEKAEADRLAELKKREDEVAAGLAKIKAAEEEAAAKQAKIDQAKREKQIAKDAAEKAKKKAEKDKVDAAEKADRDKRIAVAAAEAKAIAEAEQKEHARLAEENRIKGEKEAADAKEAKRVANKKHRTQVENEALESLEEIIALADNVGKDGCEIAYDILDAIRGDGIPHIQINY